MVITTYLNFINSLLNLEFLGFDNLGESILLSFLLFNLFAAFCLMLILSRQKTYTCVLFFIVFQLVFIFGLCQQEKLLYLVFKKTLIIISLVVALSLLVVTIQYKKLFEVNNNIDGFLFFILTRFMAFIFTIFLIFFFYEFYELCISHVNYVEFLRIENENNLEELKIQKVKIKALIITN